MSCGSSLYPKVNDDDDQEPVEINFPLVILDECSQITEPLSLLPLGMFGCKRAVLVGDPLQLPPTLPPSSNSHVAGLERTLFQRLEACGLEPILLRTQYRV